MNVLLEVLATPDHARWVFYAAALIGLIAKVRPWRVLAAVLAGLVAFGVVVHQIVGGDLGARRGGPIAVGPTSFTRHGFFATIIRHWLVLPGNHVRAGELPAGNYAFVLAIGLVLACTLVKGWRRWALLVPTLWLAAFVWETALIEPGADDASAPPRRDPHRADDRAAATACSAQQRVEIV